MWNHHEMMPHNWGGGPFMWIFWVLITVLLVLAIVHSFRLTGSPDESDSSSGAADRETPREILDRRFAEGELSREEYREKKEVLEE